MAAGIVDLIERWNGVGVVVRHDAPTGAWMFICLHDNTLGPCTGGTRMKVYPALEEALLDGLRLAEGMTAKWAALGPFGWGGGKAVLALPRPLDGEARRGLLLRYGELIDSLRGGFYTGEDMGTTSDDMRLLAGVTRYVHGFDPGNGAKVDPSPYTARGVYAGMRAALEEVFGNDDPAGRSVLVEGVGNVGRRLAEMVAAAGARLLVSDIDPRRAEETATELEAEVVPAERVYGTACDVYAPCAVGATVNADTIPQLACRVVAGSANNQLREPDDAQRLAERDILYVPDYIINAGGALSFGLMGQGEPAGEELMQRIDVLGQTVREILAEAREHGEIPTVAAERRVARALEQGRAAARA